MKLDVELAETDHPVLRRIKAALIQSFNPKAESDIETAIELGNYLVALGEYEQAQRFLECFVYLDPAENKPELWVTNGQGVVLLAHVARLIGNPDAYEKNMTALEANDLWPADIGRTRWVRMHIKDYQKVVDHAQEETQKFRCMYIGQQVLAFMYFYEVLCVRNKPTLRTRAMSRDVKRIFTDSQQLLANALKSP